MARNGSYRRHPAYRRRKRSRSGKGVPRWLITLTVLAGLFAIALGVLAGVGYGVYRSYANDLIPPDEKIKQLPRGGARILDRNGRFLYQFVDEVSGQREPVPLEEISLYLIAATTATEDASFWDNPGVNFKGLAAAGWENFWPFGGTPGILQGRGGSSITQQLVKNIYFTPDERAKRTITRKLKETVIALELTRQHEKTQIMEWYLNLISYGNIYVGAEAASRGYFGKHANELTLTQAALLAGIPSCPSCYDPINKPEAARAQRNRVLRRMYEEGYFEEGDVGRAQLWEAAIQPLEVDLQPFRVKAPHFVFNVVQPELERLFGEEALRRDGLVVYTTLDLEWQERAEAVLEEKITTYEYSGGHNGAVVAIDPNTAGILVYVGSRDYFRDDIDGRNDMAKALNSPGSAFKPFTYITALMNLGWGPGTMILDTPISSKYWDGDRPPRNPGTGFQGPITVRNALGNSLNIPAIKTILYAGVPNVIRQAKKMGITTLDERQLGPSLTVGGVDVKLIDMVYGYTVFPNLGILKGAESEFDAATGSRALDPVAVLRVDNRSGEVLYPLVDGEPADKPVIQEERVAPAEESYLISDILSDPNAQCITFGVCGALSIPGRPLAVKTGTSEPYADSFNIGDTWAIAYTPQLVVGSWYGNADNSPMFDISSTSVSWRTVRDFMVEYHQDLPVEPFTRPDGLVQASVCIPSWLKPDEGCPKTTPEDLFAKHSLPEAEDDWWTVARIDTRTGKLASELTPPKYIQERRFLQLPEDLPDFHRDQALQWAFILGASLSNAPTEQTRESDIPAVITSPADGAALQGVVTITGRARSDKFASYRLEFRSDAEPSGWTLIDSGDSPIAGGTLGIWDTSALATGSYTIRLVVVDRKRDEITTQVQVQIEVAAPAPTAAPLPTATPAEEGHAGPDRGPPRGRSLPRRN